MNLELEKQIQSKKQDVCSAIEKRNPQLARTHILELIKLCNKRPRK